MAVRRLSASSLEVQADLLGLPLASPLRRLCAFVLDCLLLLLPSIAVSLVAVILSLWLTDPVALRALGGLFHEQSREQAQLTRNMGALAPLLVRIQAPGLPPSVAVAVEQSDRERAGEILSAYSIDISLSPGANASPLAQGHIRLEAARLVPRGLRSAVLFGTAALYFTFFAARRRTATIGKRLLGIHLRRLDGRPLTVWEGFERFGGYLASLGTFGLGLLDFWREANRRLAHDRISNTVVLRNEGKRS